MMHSFAGTADIFRERGTKLLVIVPEGYKAVPVKEISKIADSDVFGALGKDAESAAVEGVNFLLRKWLENNTIEAVLLRMLISQRHDLAMAPYQFSLLIYNVEVIV